MGKQFAKIVQFCFVKILQMQFKIFTFDRDYAKLTKIAKEKYVQIMQELVRFTF